MDFALSLDHAHMLVELIEEGPIKSSDLGRPKLRNELVRAGFATMVVVDGEDGFMAATHAGKLTYCKKIVGVDDLAGAVKKRRANGELARLAR
jgi:hypothetical protein